MELVQFVTNRGTQLVMVGVDNSGRNWYTGSRHLGTQLLQFLDRGTQLVLPHHKTPNVTSDTGAAMTFETLLNSLVENVLRSWLHKAPLFQIKAVAKNTWFGNVLYVSILIESSSGYMCTIVCYDWKFFLVWNHTHYFIILK